MPRPAPRPAPLRPRRVTAGLAAALLPALTAAPAQASDVPGLPLDRGHAPDERAWGHSRIDAGVHFRAAVDEGARLCRPFGDRAYDFVDAHIRGTVRPAP